MLLGLLGGAALVGTMVLLVRRDLLADKNHMADQVEQVIKIKTRMKLEEVCVRCVIHDDDDDSRVDLRFS